MRFLAVPQPSEKPYPRFVTRRLPCPDGKIRSMAFSLKTIRQSILELSVRNFWKTPASWALLSGISPTPELTGEDAVSCALGLLTTRASSTNTETETRRRKNLRLDEGRF